MTKVYHLAGLPRSGGTWLGLVLNQNPKFYVTKPLSLFSEILWRNYSLWEDIWYEGDLMNWEVQTLKIPYLQKLTTLYFEHLTDCSTIIDNRREWATFTNIRMCEEVFGELPKIICMVRNVEEIAASYTKIYERSDRYLDEDTFLEGRLFDWPYNHLKEVYFSKYKECLYFVDYNDLVNDTDTVLDGIYVFIGEPRYKHNVDDIEASDPFPHMDISFNLKGLHKTDAGLVKSQSDARDILPNEQFLRFEKLSFWRNV